MPTTNRFIFFKEFLLKYMCKKKTEKCHKTYVFSLGIKIIHFRVCEYPVSGSCMVREHIVIGLRCKT